MTFFDRLAAAITPEASEEDRARARHEALVLAPDEGWLAHVLDQHQQIETLFIEARLAEPGANRLKAMKSLARMLSAHSMAEEGVLYPALARSGAKADATMAYEEQSMAKVEMAALEQLDPNADEWLNKLKTIRKAVAHHVYEEESEWFPRLHRTVSDTEAEMLSMRFDEEFDRHGNVRMSQFDRERRGSDRYGMQSGKGSGQTLGGYTPQ